MRRVLLAICISAAALLPATGAAAASHDRASESAPGVAVATTKILTCTGHTEHKPAEYVMSCADYNASWRKVTWSRWGGDIATGKGALYQNDCTPNCADGRFHTYGATVTLSDVVESAKYGPLYSKAKISYIERGKHKIENFKLITKPLSG